MNAANQATVPLIGSTVAIVSAYVSKNGMAAGDLPALISRVYSSLSDLGHAEVEEAPSPPQKPAIPRTHIVQSHSIGCLECGLRFRSLKRHIFTHHQLTPDDYRKKWSLAKEHGLMVAPDYSKTRSHLAKASKLGHKR